MSLFKHLGATYLGEDRCGFRVWAPLAERVEVRLVSPREALFPLEKGERIVLLTDGVFDAKNRRGERIGFENIVAFVKEHASEEQLLKIITEHVKKFSYGTEQADDLTLVEVAFP